MTIPCVLHNITFYDILSPVHRSGSEERKKMDDAEGDAETNTEKQIMDNKDWV